MRTAIITGASSGIGEACAFALAGKGFCVCLTARREERLQQISEQIIRAHGPGRAIICAGDVTDAADRARVLDSALSQWGRVDVLLNNAGIVTPGVVEEADLGAVRREFEINTFACLAWMQLVGPIMRQQRQGRIINMSSISGRLTLPGLGMYAASKYALEAISDAARLEYWPWGIRVVLIEPGAIVTDIWEKSLVAATSARPDWQASPFRDLYEKQHQHVEDMMRGRGPSPAVVAEAVCRAATAIRPRARYCVPRGTRLFSLLAFLPTRWRDWLIRRSLKSQPR